MVEKTTPEPYRALGVRVREYRGAPSCPVMVRVFPETEAVVVPLVAEPPSATNALAGGGGGVVVVGGGGGGIASTLGTELLVAVLLVDSVVGVGPLETVADGAVVPETALEAAALVDTGCDCVGPGAVSAVSAGADRAPKERAAGVPSVTTLWFVEHDSPVMSG
ncbi:hypothetical protein HQ312_17015 [Rhodococcus sp. BP-316]|uniref:hypothetical protein n=1 Tax=Rhodococcus sp. BP-316 TaxID=2739445 RepID=UPI001C9B4321|nr:hypothetical protein [Rhodococcus sp. BP-316]MBY6682758.1 hypothetical protein [Rhodococcus sp. BP-316]